MSRYTPSDGGKGSDRREGKNFEKNFEGIFGKKEPERGSFIFDENLHKFVPKSEYCRKEHGNNNAVIHGDIDSFISPIDGSVISDRRQLRNHNKRHGVTDMRDYSGGFMEKKKRERDEVMKSSGKAAKQERINTILEAINRHGG